MGLYGNFTDPYLARLSYRSTALENEYALAEVLMRRRIRSTLPKPTDKLIPKLPNFKELQENTSTCLNNLRTTTNVIERQSSLTWTWATKLEEKARMLLLCILWFDRCYLNLIYFTGIVNLIYDWSRCFFSFFYSNLFFKVSVYIFCFSICGVTVFFVWAE